MIRSFTQYISEETKNVTFVFGRFNPPTIGHQKLFDKLKSVAGSDQYRVYASKSQDPKKNPLDFKTKVKFLRRMFPQHARSVMSDSDVRMPLDIAVKLYDQGYTNVTMVAGSDRVNEFTALLNKYNGVESKHGFYKFNNGIKVISAGERDPDAEGVSGMSASKMRSAASDNDMETFGKGVPGGAKEITDLFNAVRKGMGLKESYQHRKHVQLAQVSDEREAYIEGKLFSVGDSVKLKESNEIGEIRSLGPNYVVVKFEKEKKKVWIESIEKVEEESFINDIPEQIIPKLRSFVDIHKEGLWDNIHNKRKSGKKMLKKGDPDAPTDKEFKAAQSKD